MKVFVTGASGAIGSAVVRALRMRGHRVLEGGRAAAETVDFTVPVVPAAWATRLRSLQIDAIVNCAGILMERGRQRYERVHAQGPIELFEGAALAGVARVVQISALGDGTEPYLRSKRQADAALLALPLCGSVLRPSLVYGPGVASTTLFATLAALPVVALPAGGRQVLAPLHVYELAEAVVHALERREGAPGVHELGGPALDYRTMLQAYRRAVGGGAAWTLPVPMALMMATGWAAEALPQSVFCRQTMRLLADGRAPAAGATAALLGREPSALTAGLRITPPQPALDLRVELSPAVAGLLRATLAFMWLYTALVSLALPERSGVLALLARCGFEGDVGVVALAASCALNIGLGLGVLLRPGGTVYLAQAGAVFGYTITAAVNMPELTLDHCGPLVKNAPVLAAVLVLWLARPTAPPSAQRDRDAPPRRVLPLAERGQR
jgi:uncharacterized protein YbjT (DUF2867 family)